MTVETDEIWFDPTFGASGDMILGCLIGLGADVDRITAGLGALTVSGWTIDVSEVTRCGLTATRARVTTTGDHHHRSWSSIDSELADSSLPPDVAAGARSTFRRLGEVEAAQHGVPIDEVHFHEVGAVDAVVDIVGAWIAWDLLGRPSVACGPFGLGAGTISAAHGELPLPAPATSALLAGHEIGPVDAAGETVTPTGAAVLTTMATRFGPIGSGRLGRTARGAGGRNPDTHPNVLSATLVTTNTAATTEPDAAAAGLSREDCVILSTNLDDVTGETVAYTIDLLLAAGALDAWATPIVMKKGRPAVELSVLTVDEQALPLTLIMMGETGTLGVRRTDSTRTVAERSTRTVEVFGHPVRIKVSPHGAKPEFEDVSVVARQLGVPLGQVARRAMDQFNQ